MTEMLVYMDVRPVQKLIHCVNVFMQDGSTEAYEFPYLKLITYNSH